MTDNVRSGPASLSPTININDPGSIEESRYNHYNVNTGRPLQTADDISLPLSHEVMLSMAVMVYFQRFTQSDMY